MRSDLERLLPRDFVDAYRGAFSSDPPEEFLEAYEVLCDALYWGAGGRVDDGSVSRRGRTRQSWFFADVRLLRGKTIADRLLARTASALQGKPPQAQGQGRSVPPAPHRADLARAGIEERGA